MPITENQTVCKVLGRTEKESDSYECLDIQQDFQLGFLGALEKTVELPGTLGKSWGGKRQEVWRLLPFALFLHAEAPVSPMSRILSNQYLSGISLSVMA